MSELDKINRVFSIFHDAGIDDFKIIGSRLDLKIDCQYLAERIQKEFIYFSIKINELEKLEFVPWLENEGDEVWLDPQRIFESELEISSSRIQNNNVVIIVNQHDKDYEYIGGELILKANKIKVYSENGSEIEIEELQKLAKEYWDEL